MNCICPGTIDAWVLHRVARLWPDPESAIRTCNRARALGRIGKPEGVADAVLYLASPMSSFINGSALVGDGGRLVPAGGMGLREGDTGANPQR